jgi:hypothetical protein
MCLLGANYIRRSILNTGVGGYYRADPLLLLKSILGRMKSSFRELRMPLLQE